jgi:hypothetical protein
MKLFPQGSALREVRAARMGTMGSGALGIGGMLYSLLHRPHFHTHFFPHSQRVLGKVLNKL